MTPRQRTWLHVGSIILLFFGQFLVVNPRGEFSTNDDWVHADTIKHWVDTGEFRLMPFAGPSFYVPILYGAGLVRLYGFSFELLRFSTLFLMLASLILFYVLLIRLRTRPTIALLSTILLWVNPITYNLSHSFMTDIPAMFFLVLGLLTYTIGWQTQKLTWFIAGSAATLAGAFTRQIYIVPLLALGLAGLALPQPMRRRVYLWSIIVPAILALAIYASLANAGLTPQSLGVHFYEDLLALAYHALEWLWYVFTYVGLFTLPLLLLISFNQPHQKIFAGIGVLTFGVGLAFALGNNAIFPYIGNTINLSGLGPNTDLIQGLMTPLVQREVWQGVTALSFYGAAILITWLLTKRHLMTSPGITKLFFYTTLLFIGPILIVTGFDRYFLPIFALTIILIAPTLQPARTSRVVPALMLIGLISFYSLTQTAHHLNWNRARWQLGDSILNTGIPVEHIDAGFEWDGWYGYWSAQSSGIPGGPNTSPWWIQKLMTNNTEEFVVSFSPLPNHTIIDERYVAGINPNHAMYLNKK